MNWGLFSALAGFLLPLGLAVRLATEMALARAPLWQPGQAWRFLLLMLLGMPITGKVAPVVYAVTGTYGDVSQLMTGFMVTPWGITHLAVSVFAVFACDFFNPRIVATLEGGTPNYDWPTMRFIAADASIVAILLLLAWLGAR